MSKEKKAICFFMFIDLWLLLISEKVKENPLKEGFDNQLNLEKH